MKSQSCDHSLISGIKSATGDDDWRRNLLNAPAPGNSWKRHAARGAKPQNRTDEHDDWWQNSAASGQKFRGDVADNKCDQRQQSTSSLEEAKNSASAYGKQMKLLPAAFEKISSSCAIAMPAKKLARGADKSSFGEHGARFW